MNGVPRTPELLRITALPRRILDLRSVPDFTPLFRRPGGSMRLWPIQNAALAEASERNGLFAPIGVGHGKTLLSLLLSEALESRRAVILVPPQLRDQLIGHDIPALNKHWYLPLDRIKVIAYSELSSAAGAGALEMAEPDLIVADEAHNLRHKDSARTKRFLRYFKLNPACRFVALSGTMTSKSIRDYAHLIGLALGDGSPLPLRWSELADWADAIDVGPDPMSPGALRTFCEGPEDVRSGFRRRLVQTPGVVATEEGALGTSLVIRERALEVPEVVTKALENLRRTWAIEDEELADPLALARVARQLACGFYYRWVWGPGGKDDEWLEARRAWHREVRSYLAHAARPGMDSPMLLAQAAESGKWRSQAWEAWAAVKDRPEPGVEAVWISNFMLHDAKVWALRQLAEDRNPLVWAEHTAVYEGLSDLEGTKSIKKHGTGLNLQAWNANLVTVPPANGPVWEQLIGRTHRPGQEADEVTVDVYLHTTELRAAWKNALESARYIEETTGHRQKLNFATKVMK